MAGMVPALYAQDERDALCNTIRHEVRMCLVKKRNEMKEITRPLF